MITAGIVLSGCAGVPEPPAGPPPGDPTTPASTNPAPTKRPTTPAPKPTPIPSEATRTPPPNPLSRTAADGRNYDACADGTCEVEVSRPVKIEIDDFIIEFTEVSEKKFEFTARTGNGGGSSTVSGSGGYCVTYLSDGGSSSSCILGDGAPSRPEPTKGELAVEILDFTAGTAIIRMTLG